MLSVAITAASRRKHREHGDTLRRCRGPMEHRPCEANPRQRRKPHQFAKESNAVSRQAIARGDQDRDSSADHLSLDQLINRALRDVLPPEVAMMDFVDVIDRPLFAAVIDDAGCLDPVALIADHLSLGLFVLGVLFDHLVEQPVTLRLHSRDAPLHQLIALALPLPFALDGIR
jgi:hypothetical protein